MCITMASVMNVDFLLIVCVNTCGMYILCIYESIIIYIYTCVPFHLFTMILYSSFSGKTNQSR